MDLDMTRLPLFIDVDTRRVTRASGSDTGFRRLFRELSGVRLVPAF